MSGPWISGDTLDAATLNERSGSVGTIAGFSTNTIKPQSGQTIRLQSVGFAILPSQQMSGISQFRLFTDTTDGADHGSVYICGGGGHGSTRGAQIEMTGNESAGSGSVTLSAGQGAGADVLLLTGAFTRLQVTSAGTIQHQGISQFTSGSALTPGIGFLSEASLGLYRSAASVLAQSYGTLSLENVVASSRLSVGGAATFDTEVRLSGGAAPPIRFMVDAGTDRWAIGMNLGGPASDELVIQDRQAPNTGLVYFTTGAGLAVGRANTISPRSATSGFIYVSTTTNAPSGVPTALTGKTPLFYDEGNHYLWVYAGGSWRSIAAVG